MNYLAILEQDGQAHGGLVPELNASATGKSAEQVRERLGQGIALTLLEYQRAGKVAPPAVYREASDLPADALEGFANASVELIGVAQINPVSVEVERAIEASGLSDSELARRMGSSPAAVGRLQDYFYWGHSLTVLRKLAGVLGIRVELKLAS